MILLLAIIMPWQAKAQETLTVYNGTDDNQYVPMYGNYFDDYTKSECIIPASELTGMDGGTITGLTFYAKMVATTNSSWGAANQKVFIKEVTETTLGGSFSGIEGATIVFDGLLTMPTTSTDGYTITFSEEYVYNGGNLLIGVYNDDDGSYNNVKWYGVNNLTSGVSAYGYNSSSLANVSYTAQGFLPKTTFTYEPAGGVSCAKPKNFNAVGITAHEATLTWTAGDAESDWDVFVTTDSEVVPDDNTTPTYQVTSCSKDLTGLTAQTTYYAYVRANCGDGDISKWAKKIFSTTREALAVDQNHPYEQNFETSNDWGFANGTLTNTWCWGSATNNGGSKAMYISNDGG
ncbi:MAG: fibronectin type III domain-containing protein, partial [Bacteroidales bacterium]|nr:fibronectin type III domain-containing protein [Bacteroidales bacterium]